MSPSLRERVSRFADACGHGFDENKRAELMALLYEAYEEGCDDGYESALEANIDQ